MRAPEKQTTQDLHLGVPIDVAPRPFPERIVHIGESVRLEPLGEQHLQELWDATIGGDQSWNFLRYGPFSSIDQLKDHIRNLAGRQDQPFWAVKPLPGNAAKGWMSFCDIYPGDAAIEIGSVWFSPQLQRTRAATEAVFLLMRHAFDDMSYSRLVWRCAALNTPSRRAAERYGFTFEGNWRAASIVKGWQRDVAWYSMLSAEWPAHRKSLEDWLSSGNFDDQGVARLRLDDIRRQA